MLSSIRIDVYASEEDYRRATELGCFIHHHFSFILPFYLVGKFGELGKPTYFNINEFVHEHDITIEVSSVVMLERELERQRTALNRVRDSMEHLCDCLELARFYESKKNLQELGFRCISDHSLSESIDGNKHTDYLYLITHSTRPKLSVLVPLYKESHVDCINFYWESDYVELLPLCHIHKAIIGYGSSEEKAWRRAVITWQSLSVEQRRESFLP